MVILKCTFGTAVFYNPYIAYSRTEAVLFFILYRLGFGISIGLLTLIIGYGTLFRKYICLRNIKYEVKYIYVQIYNYNRYYNKLLLISAYVTEFLSWSPFVPLSKLSFTVNMVHMPLQLINLGRLRAPQTLSSFYVVCSLRCVSSIFHHM